MMVAFDGIESAHRRPRAVAIGRQRLRERTVGEAPLPIEVMA